MSTFEYEAPFTPARPRKKRKNRIPQERPDPAVLLTNTVQELVSTGWVSNCTRKSLVSSSGHPLSVCRHLTNPAPNLGRFLLRTLS